MPVPRQQGPFTALIQYHGYSGSKAEPYSLLMWALQGYAVLAVDVRGQSRVSSDPAHYPGGHVTGWMTMVILEPGECFCYHDHEHIEAHGVRQMAWANRYPMGHPVS